MNFIYLLKSILIILLFKNPLPIRYFENDCTKKTFNNLNLNLILIHSIRIITFNIPNLTKY